MDVVRVAVAREIGDVFVRRVVLDVGPEILVNLVHRFGVCALQRGERGGTAALGYAVVHHRDGRREALDEHGVVAVVQSVMVHLVNVHGADTVVRRDESRLGVLREVAAVPKSEAAQLDHHGDAVGVVGRVLLDPLDLVGERIARRALRRVDEFLHRRHAPHAHLGLAGHLFERQLGAGPDDVALANDHVPVRLDAE